VLGWEILIQGPAYQGVDTYVYIALDVTLMSCLS
jgi:hypothetical protein